MNNELIKIESNINSNILRIELCLSNVCNYKCWYCWPGFHEGTHRWPEQDDIIPNLSHLINYYKNNLGKELFIIHIIGGEPTLWKKLGSFVQHLKENYNCIISISTNASRTLRWWESYGHYFDHVMISVHHERADISHINAVADILYLKNVWVNAMVLMDPNCWDKCIQITDELRKSKRRWAITAIALINDTVNYTEEQLKYFKNSLKRIPSLWYYFKCKKLPHTNSTIFFNNGSKKKVPHNWIGLNKLNYFKGWECNIGIDTLYIDKDGNIRGGCGIELYNLSFFYNIYDSNFTKKFNPKLRTTICTIDCCTCMPEINARKKKI